MTNVPGSSAPLPPEVSRTEFVEPQPSQPWQPMASPRRALLTVIALSAGGFIFVTNELAPHGLIKLMASDLGRSESQIGLLVTAFAVVVLLTTVPLTLLTRKIPRRFVLAAAFSLLAMSALLLSVLDHFSALVVARLLSALGQGLFWAVINSTAAALYPPQVRGRIVARLLIGSSLAGVAGLPGITRLGQLTQWQTPFFLIAGIAAFLAVATFFLVPHYRPEAGSAARALDPSMRRFVAALAVVCLASAANAVTYTYVTPFFVDVTGFDESAVPTLLLVAGLLSVTGTITVGRFLDRRPMRTVAAALAMVSLVWAGLAFAGGVPAVAAAMLFLQNFAWAWFVASCNNRMMRHAPGSTDVAVGASGSVYNLGVASGSLLGSYLLANTGPHILPLASLVITVVAVVVLVSEWRTLNTNAQPFRQLISTRR